MSSKKRFDYLIKISLIVFVLVLIFGIMLKSIMPKDLIDNYRFLSTMNLKERFIRGIKIIEFYKIEYQLGIIKRTVILDILNIFVFIPFGMLVTHFFKKRRIVKVTVVTFFLSLIIELFQLIFIIGSFMLNDLIFNVLGGIIGSVIYLTVVKKEQYKVYNILLIVFLLIISGVLIYLIINFLINIDVYCNILLENK